MSLPVIYITCTIRVGRKSCKIRIFFGSFLVFMVEERKKGGGEVDTVERRFMYIRIFFGGQF